MERPCYGLGKTRKGLSELVKLKMRYRRSDKEAVARRKETGAGSAEEETAGAEVQASVARGALGALPRN